MQYRFQRILRRVEIQELFGYLNYDLDFERDESGSVSTAESEKAVSLLYGQNGSGKTTVLRLIYSALASSRGEGLRSYISLVPFKAIRFHLNENKIISIYKSRQDGSYEYHFAYPDETRRSYKIVPSGEGRVNEQNNPKYKDLIQELDELNINFYFLTDKRDLRSNTDQMIDRQFTGGLPVETSVKRINRPEPLNLIAKGEVEDGWYDLQLVTSLVTNTFRRQIIEHLNYGQSTANVTYVDIARKLAAANLDLDRDIPLLADVVDEIDSLIERAGPIREIGAIEDHRLREIKDILLEAPAERINDIVIAIGPHLDTIRARVEALEPLATKINILTRELNKYFDRKTIRFNVYQGFEITNDFNSRPISITNLSSGEKHLFLLFCSAYISQESKCIFLIDEPELSLNVYWQRNLVKTLLKLTEDSPVQYIMATHSIEILSEYRPRLVTLEGIQQ